MPKRVKPVQYTFGAGELAPDLAMRRDTQQYRDGAKSLRNNRLLVTGGAARRPGTWRLHELTGSHRICEFVVNEATKYIVAFNDGTFDAFLPDGTAAGSLTGCPWIGDSWKTMDYVQSGNTIFLTHSGIGIHVIQRVGPSSWQRSVYGFYQDPAGRLRQPYLKLAPDAMTLQPSALTGAVTLTTSAAYWVAGHVGCRVRYLGREIQITSITSSTVANGNVVEELRPSQTLTVGSTGGFQVGDVIEGSTSAAKGKVTSINSGTSMTVVVIDKLLVFQSETLIGPNSKTSISSVVSATPGAITDWDEQLFSNLNGWPACIEIHRNRLLMGGSPAVPNAIVGSRIDNIYNFDVGTAGDAEGFAETIGDAAAVQIQQLRSAEQLLIFTDRGPYYVPESASNPFRPSSLAFNHFGGEWPCAVARTGAFDGGVVMVSKSLVVKVSPTGDQTRQWSADEVSLLSYHLVNAPTDTGFCTNFNDGPERYALFTNANGTMAVLQLIEAQEIRNLVPWDTDGLFKSVACLGSEIYVTVERTIDGVTRWFLEKFDQSLTLDCVTSFDDLDDVPAKYGDAPVQVVVGNYALGTYPIALDDPPDGPYRVGFFYERVIETLPPNIEDQEGSYAGELVRIVSADVNVLTSARFAANGHELSAYQVTDPLDQAPPLRSGPQRFSFLGWKIDPTITITQPDPLPLTCLGIKMKVAF